MIWFGKRRVRRGCIKVKDMGIALTGWPVLKLILSRET
jgi:hypothetical protein